MCLKELSKIFIFDRIVEKKKILKKTIATNFEYEYTMDMFTDL